MKTITIALLLFFSTHLPAYSGDSLPGALFPVVHKGKYGYIDAAGAVVLKPVYRAGGAYAEGFAAVIIDRWWCFIDRTGAVAIPGPFSFADRFSQGLASVADTTGRCFYVDTNGTEKITPEKIVAKGDRADRVYAFSDGIAVIRCYQNLYFINRAGTVLFKKNDVSSNMPPIYASDGLIPFGVPVGDSTRFGYMNYKGAVVLLPQWDYVTSFSEGKACIGIKKEQRWTTGHGRHDDAQVWAYAMTVIDKKGKKIISGGVRTEEEGVFFSGGLAAVEKNGVRCYINAHDSTALTPPFEALGPFVNGLARVARRLPGKFPDEGPFLSVYIDRKGRVVWQDTGWTVDCGHERRVFLRR
jgi:hypothetical protein